MLFDPSCVVEQPVLALIGTGIVLVAKPIAALAIVAIGLAQSGEFSFILAQVARQHGLMPGECMDRLVATAMISITLNPIRFRSIGSFEQAIERAPWLARLLEEGAGTVVNEEGIALPRHVLERRGVPPAQIERLLQAMRRIWNIDR